MGYIFEYLLYCLSCICVIELLSYIGVEAYIKYYILCSKCEFFTKPSHGVSIFALLVVTDIKFV